MTKKNWFAGKIASHDRNPLFRSFLRVIGRSRRAPEAREGRPGVRPAADTGAESCWTAALHRGGSLPLFRLSILSAENSDSAMRLEPCPRDPGPSHPAKP